MSLSAAHESKQVQRRCQGRGARRALFRYRGVVENVGDDGDLKEVYDTERQLLYVACTRARDRLSISGVEPASEFLDDVAG